MFLQAVDIVLLSVKTTKELILFLVDIGIPRLVTIGHSLHIGLNLGQVFLHLNLLLFQMIPLRSPQNSIQVNRNKERGLTLVLSPARSPQS